MSGEKIFHCCPVRKGCYCDKSSKKSSLFDWSWVDQIYCICLKSRDDRMKESEDVFHSTGLCTRVVYHRPVRDPKGGVRGSYESHRLCTKKARDEGHSNVLIFEDDIIFKNKFSPSTLRKAVRGYHEMVKKDSYWEIFFLGHMPYYSVPESYPIDLVRVKAIYIHAYVINLKSRYARWICKTPYDSVGVILDQLIKNGKAKRCYGCYPMIAFQRGGDSDIASNVSYWNRHNETILPWMEDGLSCMLWPFLLFLLILFILILSQQKNLWKLH